MNLYLHLTRHLTAWGIAFVVALLIWAVQYWQTYIGPSAIATADDGRFLLGSTLTVVITAVILAIIFLPATIAGAVARRLLDLPKWTELLIALVCGSVFSTVLTDWYVKEFTTHSSPSLEQSLKGFGIYLAGPLCIYWLIARHGKLRDEADASDGNRLPN